MDLMLLQVLLVCGFLAFLALIYAGVLWTTARRAADGDDAFIRRLPLPPQPLAVREAQLRLLVHQELIKYVKIDAVIAGGIVVLGVVVTVSATVSGDQAPIWVGIAVTAMLMVVYFVLLAVMHGLLVLARYRGAQRHLHTVVVWHASSEGLPAARTDI